MPPARRSEPQRKPYPEEWERVADLRVFRAAADEWERLTVWSADMRRRGWKLLRVSTEGTELVAVYGRSRDAHPA
jgi:hypothetical protein